MVYLLKLACTPIVWGLTLILLGLVSAKCLRRKSGSKLGWFLLLLGTLILYLFSINPVSRLLVYSLESQYRLPGDDALATLDVVIVLGGGMYGSGGLRERPEMGPITYSRLVSGVDIFRRSGAGTLVLSGGGPQRTDESEAAVMKALSLELGVPEDQIVVEAESRNTMEQGVALSRMFDDGRNRRIGLVTSALHMMRSEKTFEGKFQQDTIVPLPVNYIYNPLEWNIKSIIPSAGELVSSTCALHEWIGIIWYEIRY